MNEQYGDQVNIIGIPGLGGLTAMEVFIVNTGTEDLAHIPDIDGDLWARFDVTQQSTYIYINDDGTLTKTGYGSLEADVEQLIIE